MQFSTDIYFIAIVADDRTKNVITPVKQDLALHYGAVYALKVVPHITLIKPFTLPHFKHDYVQEWFSDLSFDIPSFRIELDGFGTFPGKNKPVIYVNVNKNEGLSLLRSEIRQAFRPAFPEIPASHSPKSFIPHMTVAYRDLTPANYERAWSAYQIKTFQAEFDVDSFKLLKHDRKQWNIIASNQLGQVAIA
jgi:2'-5' RNA ligase